MSRMTDPATTEAADREQPSVCYWCMPLRGVLRNDDTGRDQTRPDRTGRDKT